MIIWILLIGASALVVVDRNDPAPVLIHLIAALTVVAIIAELILRLVERYQGEAERRNAHQLAIRRLDLGLPETGLPETGPSEALTPPKRTPAAIVSDDPWSPEYLSEFNYTDPTRPGTSTTTPVPGDH